MRVAALVVLGGLVVAVAGACTSGGGSPATTADAGTSGAGLGEPCDPSAKQPCELLTDACSVAVCESRVCVRVPVDGGPTCGGAGPLPCASGECDGGGDAADATSDAAMEGGDAGAGDGASDGAADAGGDSSLDGSEPVDAGDAGGD